MRISSTVFYIHLCGKSSISNGAGLWVFPSPRRLALKTHLVFSHRKNWNQQENSWNQFSGKQPSFYTSAPGSLCSDSRRKWRSESCDDSVGVSYPTWQISTSKAVKMIKRGSEAPTTRLCFKSLRTSQAAMISAECLE